ncbi:Nif3-like dinuclear metal center hexameric protein [Maribacter sp. 2304DJ31-5]|uniref:Nif3-like dinuclear metal center hexameric protein n=1 Tax=Maribacter sp. 2304DJ31-5 TaxID=3386273 RepID=UPI0039BC272E
MTVNEVALILEKLAPLDYAEDFDNVGLLIGDKNTKVKGILVTLDTLENVVDEAIEKNCNLIISFHPIIFKGLKKITGKNYVERVVLKAIQNNINIYSIHTALDNCNEGVNAKICEVLELTNTKILIPQKGTIKKLTFYAPIAESQHLKEKLFAVGAGNMGNYSECSFSVEGIGSYKASELANPTLGEKGITHREEEALISMTFPKHLEHKVIRVLLQNHSYEEVAYEVITLENTDQNIGMGRIGELKTAMGETEFLGMLKKKMHTPVIRHSGLLKKPIKKVAVLGGSGAFSISAAKAAGADILVTADLKYHQFYEAEGQLIIADIGHFETEQFTKNLLVEYLMKKIPNFAIRLSESITNPIKYF